MQLLQDGSLVVPAYLDGLGQAQHGMVSHLNMGMSPNRDPQMHHGLTQSMQEEDEQYDDEGAEHDGEAGRDADVPGEIADSRTLYGKNQPKSNTWSLVLGRAHLPSVVPTAFDMQEWFLAPAERRFMWNFMTAFLSSTM